MAGIDVAVVILHWRNLDDTATCLESVFASEGVKPGVWLVDNGSGDDLNALQEKFPELTIIRLPENLGFAAGNNAGIRAALKRAPEAVLLLNNDTVVASDAISKMLHFLRSSPGAGAVVPKIFYFHQPDLLWYAGGKIAWWKVSVQHFGFRRKDGPAFGSPCAVTFATGCALLVRREIFDRVGLLNEEFYSYFEDVEFSLRLQRAGFRILYCPDAHIWHKVGAGTQAQEYSPYYLYYQTRNRFWALAASRNLVYRIYARLFEGLVYFLLRIFLITLRRGEGWRQKAAAVALGYRDGLLRRMGAEKRWEKD